MLKKLLLIISALTPLYLVRFSVGNIPTNLFEMLLLLGIAVFILKKQGFAFKFKDFFKQNHYFIFGLSLLLFGLLISTANNGVLPSELGILKSWFVVPLIFALAIYSSWGKTADVESMLKIWFYSWSLLALSALIAKFVFVLQTYDGRLAFIYGSPNYLAMLLAPAVIIGTHLIRYGKQKNLLLICQFLIIAALYFTYSYATWISLLLALGFQLLPKLIPTKRLKLFAAFSLLIILLGVSQLSNPKFQTLVNFSERSSLSSRLMIWKAATKILSDHVATGIGPGNFQIEYLKYQRYFPPYLEWAVPQPHNLLLAFWLQSGILGLIGFILIISNIIYRLLKNKESGLSLVLMSYFVYLILHGLLDTPIWKNDLSFIFWVLIFAALFISQKQKTKPRDLDL